MYLDDFGDFPRSPPYFGYNSAGQENPVLCIFSFQGPIRTQNDLDFLEDQYFPNYDDTKRWNQANRVRRGDRAGVARPPPGRATCALGALEPPQPSIQSSRRFP